MMGEPFYVDESSLKNVRVLGRGTYGSVSLMIHSGNQFYAKKTSSVHLRENLEKELRIMLRFRNHPRIVQASCPFLHSGLNPQECYIFMEFASEGTLHKLISGLRLPEYIIKSVARMILQGLEALHSHGYVHCDLKPSNILLFPSTNSGDPWDLKLADFGVSKEPNTDSDRHMLLGTHQYMSPESFKPNTPIDAALDIWSLGCIGYEMFGGKPTKEMFEEYYDWTLPKEIISPVAKDFLRQCHAPYSQRATAAELLKHPFITQTVRAPLPTTRQQVDWPMIPKLPGSIW